MKNKLLGWLYDSFGCDAESLNIAFSKLKFGSLSIAVWLLLKSNAFWLASYPGNSSLYRLSNSIDEVCLNFCLWFYIHCRFPINFESISLLSFYLKHACMSTKECQISIWTDVIPTLPMSFRYSCDYICMDIGSFIYKYFLFCWYWIVQHCNKFRTTITYISVQILILCPLLDNATLKKMARWKNIQAMSLFDETKLHFVLLDICNLWTIIPHYGQTML